MAASGAVSRARVQRRDFYCTEARLCIEVDGQVHGEGDQARKDKARDVWLAREGIRVVRIAAEDVRVDLDGVVGWIDRVVKERLAR